MPRYVILEHDHLELHWDFMLEAGNILRTWKLPAPPVYGELTQVKLSFDHRLVYLDYEGPISGDRGSVVRWDSGNYIWQTDEKDRVSVYIEGARLRGLVEFFPGSSEEWYMRLTQTAAASS